MLLTDLFSFAYVPGWYNQLDELAKLALPEPWCFRNPMYSIKNPDTPIKIIVKALTMSGEYSKI